MYRSSLVVSEKKRMRITRITVMFVAVLASASVFGVSTRGSEANGSSGPRPDETASALSGFEDRQVRHSG